MVNEQQLNTVTGNGTQSSTQDPQSANPSNSLVSQSGNVQTGVGSNVLESQQGGIPLYNSPIPALNLNQASQSTTVATSQSAHHSPNLVLLSFSGVLLVIAVVLFWSTSRSAKNTTQ